MRWLDGIADSVDVRLSELREIVKATYDKPMANVILNAEKLKAFPVRSRTTQ